MIFRNPGSAIYVVFLEQAIPSLKASGSLAAEMESSTNGS